VRHRFYVIVGYLNQMRMKEVSYEAETIEAPINVARKKFLDWLEQLRAAPALSDQSIKDRFQVSDCRWLAWVSNKGKVVVQPETSRGQRNMKAALEAGGQKLGTGMIRGCSQKSARALARKTYEEGQNARSK
jgi:hypothetical protein